MVHQQYYYGTKLDAITAPGKLGNHAIKEIEVQGLLRIEESGMIDGMYATIFLDIPEEIMIERMRTRGETDEAIIAKRLESSALERSVANKYCTYILDASLPLEEVVENFRTCIKKHI